MPFVRIIDTAPYMLILLLLCSLFLKLDVAINNKTQSDENINHLTYLLQCDHFQGTCLQWRFFSVVYLLDNIRISYTYKNKKLDTIHSRLNFISIYCLLIVKFFLTIPFTVTFTKNLFFNGKKDVHVKKRFFKPI